MATILGANTLSSGFDVANSVRFNDNDSPSMYKTPGSGGDQRTWTFSTWFKRGNIGTSQWILDAYDGSNDEFHIYISSGNAIGIYTIGGGFGNNLSISTSNLVRDTSAWYHLVVRCDTTQGTASDRLRIYLNGTECSYGTYNNFTENGQGQVSESGTKHWIGRRNAGDYFDGYFAEMVLVDGSSLAPTSFGEFDSDSPKIWKPIDVSGLTFGTNGFYLDFEDASNLGNDANGGTDFTEANLATTDQSTDTCTNNFATLNNRVNSYSTNVTFTEGNLKATHPGVWGGVPATIGVQNGRWYWECKVTTGNAANAFTGIAAEDVDYLDATVYDETGLLLYFVDGRKTVDGSNSEGFFDSLATDDIVGVHLDLDSGTKTCTFTKNGSTSGSAVNLTANHTGKFVLPVSIGNSSSATANWEFNFGSPSYSISSGNADDNGHGNFEYPPNISSTSYYALCTKNLAEFG